MMQIRKRALLALVALVMGCTGDSGTGPAEVKWDRFDCERCRMVLSDPYHAAQIRIHQADGKAPVKFFDDLGCALIWLEDKPFKDDPGTEIWVNDWRAGAWIDARRAHYVTGQSTPMEYGLGAQVEADPKGLTFDQARERVLTIERQYNVHGAHAPAQ